MLVYSAKWRLEVSRDGEGTRDEQVSFACHRLCSHSLLIGISITYITSPVASITLSLLGPATKSSIQPLLLFGIDCHSKREWVLLTRCDGRDMILVPVDYADDFQGCFLQRGLHSPSHLDAI
jgi:hypothetical protein